jgi:hypothetical protein
MHHSQIHQTLIVSIINIKEILIAQGSTRRRMKTHQILMVRRVPEEEMWRISRIMKRSTIR